MNPVSLSNRRITRENLLMFFYSREFLEGAVKMSNERASAFLKDAAEVRSSDPYENLRDSVREVFDSVRILKLEPSDRIEFETGLSIKKVKMTFEEMDNENVKDGFFSKTVDIAEKIGLSPESPAVPAPGADTEKNLAFFTEYVNTYYNNLETVDSEIKDSLENWDFGRISVIDKIILRMGIIEIKYFSDIPSKVIINEAIELGKKYSSEKSNVFINGILNRIKDVHRNDENTGDNKVSVQDKNHKERIL